MKLFLYVVLTSSSLFNFLQSSTVLDKQTSCTSSDGTFNGLQENPNCKTRMKCLHKCCDTTNLEDHRICLEKSRNRVKRMYFGETTPPMITVPATQFTGPSTDHPFTHHHPSTDYTAWSTEPTASPATFLPPTLHTIPTVPHTNIPTPLHTIHTAPHTNIHAPPTLHTITTAPHTNIPTPLHTIPTAAHTNIHAPPTLHTIHPAPRANIPTTLHVTPTVPGSKPTKDCGSVNNPCANSRNCPQCSNQGPCCGLMYVLSPVNCPTAKQHRKEPENPLYSGK